MITYLIITYVLGFILVFAILCIDYITKSIFTHGINMKIMSFIWLLSPILIPLIILVAIILYIRDKFTKDKFMF